jgi:hypothetical protein
LPSDLIHWWIYNCEVVLRGGRGEGPGGVRQAPLFILLAVLVTGFWGLREVTNRGILMRSHDLANLLLSLPDSRVAITSPRGLCFRDVNTVSSAFFGSDDMIVINEKSTTAGYNTELREIVVLRQSARRER